MNKPKVKNELPSQMEAMRIQVIDLELKARYWKAQHDIKYYVLESEKLVEPYEEHIKKEQAKHEENMAKLNEQISVANLLAEEGKVEVK